MIISLTPKQIHLKNVIEKTNFQWIGYGGSRGGAKSHAVRDLAYYFAKKYNIQVLIFRKFRDDLLKNHVYPLLRLRPDLRPYFNKSELVIYDDYRNPLIKFDYAETEEDIYKVGQGTEYQLIFIDEATQITQGMIEYLSTACRDSFNLFPATPKVICTMNPGGAGHAFIKRIFVDKIYNKNENPNAYYFIQAHVWDNVFWVFKELQKQGITIQDYYKKWSETKRVEFTIEHSDYAQRLGNLPYELMKAYLYGDWNVFGGMFFKNFDSTKEVIEPFEIPANWEIVGSLDPGFSAPLSFGVSTKDLKGNIYRIGTYYNIDSIPNHAIAVKEFLTSKDSPIYKYTNGRMPRTIVAGRDAFAKVDRNAIVNNEDTIFDYFRRQGIILQQGNDGPGTRIANWWKWKSLIPDRFFVFKGLNEPLLTQMTSVESDDKAVEDIKGRGNDPTIEDHALDDCKLGVAALHTAIEREYDTRPEWIKNMQKELKQKEIKQDFMAV